MCVYMRVHVCVRVHTGSGSINGMLVNLQGRKAVFISHGCLYKTLRLPRH